MIDQKSHCDELCDDRQLRLMLRSDTDSHDSAEILEHVEKCQRCQQRLDALAADEVDLQKTVDVLSSKSQADELDNHHANAFGVPQPGWTESIARQLLLPPSHPELMDALAAMT